MNLWTEYEGITVDGAFPLNKLLKPEGRSAFYSTLNAKGEPVLIRLIECHFDEDEILARWRGVQALGQPNFLRIDRFGQLTIDDTTVVYAAFERVDMDLAQVLEQGCLGAADATGIGRSVASALETLHAHGFVHEHVEPRNIYAVGESVKLRSDCIRETPEGVAGLEARRRDVHDLALVLMQVLLGTGRRRPGMQVSLPAPFDEIVRKGLSGEWGLEEMRAALEPARAAEPVKAPVVEEAKPAMPDAKAFTFRKPARPEPAVETSRLGDEERVVRASFLPQARLWEGAALKLPETFKMPAWARNAGDARRRWVVAGVLVLAVLLFGWFVEHRIARHGAAVAPAVAGPGTTRHGAAHTAARQASSAAPGVRDGAARDSAVRSAGSQWRVVAFTYNREDQARKKASTLEHSQPEMRPEVFSPTGRAPFLVTVGGALGRDDANALARKARGLGLPRDTYAQNYKAR